MNTSRASASFLQRYKYWLAMTVVLVVAAFMRFHDLASLPPGLHPDEAANGLDVLTIIKHHNFQPFYPGNGGREGLFFIIQALFVWLFGNTTYALRLAPALISTVAVGVVYLWASSWFGKRTGLITAAIMAGAPWAIIIGRDGFRAGLMAVVVPLTLYLYTKAIQGGKTGWYVSAGVSFGAGFYTYLAFRLFPVAVGVGLVYAFIWRRRRLYRWRRGLTISLVAAAITLIPMGVYGVHHPDQLFARTGGVSITNPTLNHGHLFETFGSNIVKTALMFNFQGDQNYRQNLGGQPELNVFVGIMFILGIFVCFTRLRSFRYSGLLVVFGVMLLPEILTAEGIPHALRSFGSMPEAMALAGVGISYLLDQWYGVFPLNAPARMIGASVVVVLLLLSTYQGYVEYFVAWANAPQTYGAYSEDTTAVATYYNTHPFHGVRYAIGGGYGLTPLQYLTYDRTSYTQVDPSSLAKMVTNPLQAKEFSMEEGDKPAALKILEREFPHGRISPHYSSFSGKELFATYTVPAS